MLKSLSEKTKPDSSEFGKYLTNAREELPDNRTTAPRLGEAMTFVSETGSNRSPSKRVRPDGVPTQRYPSIGCATPVTTFSGKPSSACHGCASHSSFVPAAQTAGAMNKKIPPTKNYGR